MATINYLYRSTKANAPLTVRLLYRHNDIDSTVGANSRYEIYSKDELIKNPNLNAKDYWKNFHSKTRVKDIEMINRQVQVNNDLNKLKNFILAEFEKTLIENIDKSWLDEVIENFYNPKAVSEEVPKTLVEYFDYYLQQRKLKKNSIQNLTTVKNKLEKFLNGKKVLLTEINDSFRDKFITFFSDFSYNTVMDDLRRIKTICKHAKEKGFDISNDVFKWQIKPDDTLFIYLTEKELEILQNKNDLPEHLENAKDWLLISCFTAQRVSDFMRFKINMVKEKKYSEENNIHVIEFTQVKTNKIMALPLSAEVMQILEKRNNNFPRQISEQKYNDYIKEVCKACGINEKVYGSKKNPKTNRKEIGYFEKWELITSHIGRRTFANYHYYKGTPNSAVIYATGHSTEKMLLKYINKVPTEQAKQLAMYLNMNI